MLTKILFTLVVIIGVAIFYRNKAMTENQTRAKKAQAEKNDSIPTRALAYVLIGVLIAISIAVFAYNWQQNNRIFNIKVTASSGEVINYQARHQDIDGRTFVTMDGIQVSVGQDDKMEMRVQ